MSIALLAAAAEPDWFARITGAIGIATGAFSLVVAWLAFRRNGYKVKVRATVDSDRLENYPEGSFTRVTYVNVIVSNHRAGEVQIVGFYGHDGVNPPQEIGLIGNATFTLKGISQEKCRTHGRETPDDPAHGARVRIGAKLANDKIVWSNWLEMGPKAAEQVVASRF